MSNSVAILGVGKHPWSKWGNNFVEYGVAAAREDRHIAIDVLSRFLPPKPELIAAMLVDLFTAAVCAALAWFSSDMVRFAFEDDEQLLGGLPAWGFQMILPVGFALICYRYLLWVGKRGVALVRGEAA